MAIHPTAVVDSAAEVDGSAEIGPYCVVRGRVRIGADTRLIAHVFVDDYTTIGARCTIHPFAVVGHEPQDLAWTGEASFTTIGDDTIIREHAEIHRGTKPETTTRVGSRVFVMSGAHIAHNCEISDDVKITSKAQLAGYVSVGPRAFIGGGAQAHQFTRIGELVMVGGAVRVWGDVPPFCLATIAGPAGLNSVGLRRAEISSAARNELRRAYKLLFRSGMPKQRAVAAIAELVETAEGKRFLAFLQGESLRGMMRFRETGIVE